MPRTLLGRLLAERGLHSHAEFVREYRRAAQALGDHGAGPGPSRAQLHRWLSGHIAGLPQPHHRHVLDAMFPGYGVRQLLAVPVPAPGTPGSPAARPPGARADASGPRAAAPGAVAAPGMRLYPDRPGFLAAHPPDQLLRGVRRVRAAGVALDLLCGALPAAALTAAVRSGTSVECLLLDPDGAWSARRSLELGHLPGHLGRATRTALDRLEQVRTAVGEQAGAGVSVALYDEPPRYALLLLDDLLAVVQAYLPHAPGEQAPVLVVDAAAGAGRLFAVYERLYDELVDVSVTS